MNFIDMIKMRRSVYALNKNLPVSKKELLEIIKDAVLYVPDAFNMKSQRVLVLLGEKHKEFWDVVYDELVATTGKKISRDKIDSFAAGYGTVLFFYDAGVVDEYKKQFAQYADNFNNWAMQSNAMLQFAIWTALADIKIGASLQHYNPIIDEIVCKKFDVPDNWVLNAQMPFGGISVAPEPKSDDNVIERMKIKE